MDLLFIMLPYYSVLTKEILPEIFSAPHKNVTDIYDMACEYYGKERVQLNIGLDNYSTEMYIGSLYYNIDPENAFETLYEATQGTLNNTLGENWSPLSLLIYFPEVKIENEINEKHTIYDAFVRVPLNNDGRIRSGISILKATYTNEEIESSYLHSHCHRITGIYNWEVPCLGYGPLRNTQMQLLMDYSKETFKVFFWELDKMMHVESLSGVPYIRMRDIGKDNKISRVDNVSYEPIRSDTDKNIICNFVLSYLKSGKQKFTFMDNQWCLGERFMDWYIGISEYFINWKESRASLLEKEDPWIKDKLDSLLNKYIIKDGVLYTERARSRTNSFYNGIGKYLLTFNNREFNFNIQESPDSHIERILLLNIKYALYIMNAILTTLNSNYEQFAKCGFSEVSYSAKTLPVSY